MGLRDKGHLTRLSPISLQAQVKEDVESIILDFELTGPSTLMVILCVFICVHTGSHVTKDNLRYGSSTSTLIEIWSLRFTLQPTSLAGLKLRGPVSTSCVAAAGLRLQALLIHILLLNFLFFSQLKLLFGGGEVGVHVSWCGGERIALGSKSFHLYVSSRD